jgi:lysophospholipase L1-like esterase
LSFCLSAFAQHGWTGTWASAPLPGKPDPALAGKTLRQTVHTSVSGSRLRVRISNAFGDQPLRIENIHIAIASAGGSIVAASDHQLRFHHRTSVIIPPGASFVSDALRFEVSALSDLTVSLYLPSAPGSITWHPSAHVINFMANGDHSSAPSLPNPERTGSCYFLTGVEVQGSGLHGAVVTLGASITEGYKVADGSHREWPAILAEHLVAQHLGVGVLNEGISGNRLLQPGAGPSAATRFQSDVLRQPGVRWVIFSDDPINDLGATRPLPALDQLIGATERLIAAARRQHIRFYCSTLTPYEGANYWTPTEEIIREHFNDFIRGTGSGCDAVIDEDRATHDPSHPTRFLPAYDSGDHLHPNDAGHRAIAEAIDLSLFR